MSTIEHIEEVKMILLNRSNRILGVVHLSKGRLSGSIIAARLLLPYASRHMAADIKITSRVKEGLGLVDIMLLNHLIMNSDEQYSNIECNY